ncbi:MAG: hypothetical protein LAQ69_50400 [Acidobacteriia bacterium]|nr:hypothetical protein [Terriglobia bacterium]
MHLLQALRRQYRWLRQQRSKVRDLLGVVIPRRDGDARPSRRDVERARFWAAMREGQREAERLCAVTKNADGSKR